LQILEEMQRILNSKNSLIQAKQVWLECTPKIIKQAKLENGMRIREKIASLAFDDKQDGM